MGVIGKCWNHKDGSHQKKIHITELAIKQGKMKISISLVFGLYCAFPFLFAIVESGVGRNSDPTYDLICGQSCIEQPYDGDVEGIQCCKSHKQICCREKGHRHSCYSCKELPKEEKDNIRDIH